MNKGISLVEVSIAAVILILGTAYTLKSFFDQQRILDSLKYRVAAVNLARANIEYFAANRIQHAFPEGWSPYGRDWLTSQSKVYPSLVDLPQGDLDYMVRGFPEVFYDIRVTWVEDGRQEKELIFSYPFVNNDQLRISTSNFWWN